MRTSNGTIISVPRLDKPATDHLFVGPWHYSLRCGEVLRRDPRSDVCTSHPLPRALLSSSLTYHDGRLVVAGGMVAGCPPVFEGDVYAAELDTEQVPGTFEIGRYPCLTARKDGIKVERAPLVQLHSINGRLYAFEILGQLLRCSGMWWEPIPDMPKMPLHRTTVVW